MFIVYGVNGQNFRGPLENLARVPGVPSARRARAVETEGEELGLEYYLETGRRRVGDAKRVPNSTYSKAADAYAKLLPQQVDRGPVRHAYQVMTRDVFSLPASTTVRAAWHSLMERGVHQAPVLNPTMEVIGLVSERDLLTVIDIRRIARVLLDTGLTALPVVGEAGALLGVVSRGDILRAAVADPPLSLWV